MSGALAALAEQVDRLLGEVPTSTDHDPDVIYRLREALADAHSSLVDAATTATRLDL